jgi:ribonuclease PH
LLSRKKEIGPPANIVTGSVAAVSVGLCGGEEWLDLCYEEDKDADVDLNLVMTGDSQFIEVQGTGEEATFTRAQLDRLLQLGQHGISKITAAQKKALGSVWPF